MTSTTLPRDRHELARYLDRVRSLYPRGIPTDTIAAATVPSALEPDRGPAAPRPSVCFIVISPDSSLSRDLAQLLESIIVKGLELDPGSVPLEAVAATDEAHVHTALSDVVARHRPHIVVLMGSALVPAGSWGREGETEVLHTRSLAEVRDTPAIKREFWTHLKGVLARLNALG